MKGQTMWGIVEYHKDWTRKLQDALFTFQRAHPGCYVEHGDLGGSRELGLGSEWSKHPGENGGRLDG